MYTSAMRRIQIYLDEELDERLKAVAARGRVSKASLIRDCVAERYGALEGIEGDPISALVGAFDVDPADVDEVVYGPAPEKPGR